jgi:hypothetical protein
MRLGERKKRAAGELAELAAALRQAEEEGRGERASGDV